MVEDELAIVPAAEGAPTTLTGQVLLMDPGLPAAMVFVVLAAVDCVASIPGWSIWLARWATLQGRRPAD